ncbi:HNH endonuclease, partial [Burkholderia multivorans]
RAPGSPPRTIAILAETAAVPKDERVLIDPSPVGPPQVGSPRVGPSLVGPTSRTGTRPTRRQPLASAGSVREDSPCERRLRNDLVARAAP